jgi:mannan polymerase II complex ANP1 subunit
MQEMEQERLARESEEREHAERMKKIKEQFTDPNKQWEKDKTDIQNMATQEETKEQDAAGEDSKASSPESSDQVQDAAGEENKASSPGSSNQVQEAAAAENAAR